jgi:hypothetical protein
MASSHHLIARISITTHRRPCPSFSSLFSLPLQSPHLAWSPLSLHSVHSRLPTSSLLLAENQVLHRRGMKTLKTIFSATTRQPLGNLCPSIAELQLSLLTSSDYKTSTFYVLVIGDIKAYTLTFLYFDGHHKSKNQTSNRRQ